jgi:hypothetical protein
MSEDIGTEIEIDYRLDAYKTIFNHVWSEQLGTLTDGTKLADAAFHLCKSWRAAVNTHTFPWQMMAAMGGAIDGAARHSVGEKFIASLAKELAHRMGDSMRQMAKRKLADEIQKIGQQFNEFMAAQNGNALETEEIWQSFLEPELWEFQMAIWGSQQLVFSAIFHAYENYIRELLVIAEGNPDYIAYRWATLAKDIAKHLGQAVADECLNNDFVTTSRNIRNALAHNGGKVTDELKDCGVPVIKDILQIQPPHNRALIAALERRVILLSEAAIKLPQFARP